MRIKSSSPRVFSLSSTIKMEASAELQWSLIKNSSKFIVRRRGPRGHTVTLTREPNNLTNRNSYKFNGLINRKVVSVESGKDNKGLVLRTKKSRKGNKPRDTFVKIPLNSDRRRTYRFVRKHLGSTDYRQDLREYAVRRASAIISSQRPLKRLRTKRKRH